MSDSNNLRQLSKNDPLLEQKARLSFEKASKEFKLMVNDDSVDFEIYLEEIEKVK